MEEIIFVLCEGPHDIAFLYRILRTQGFEPYKNKIGDYPYPIGNFIKQSLNDFTIDDTKLSDLGKRIIPSEAMVFEKKLYLFYTTHGDSKKEARKYIVENMLNFKSSNENTANNFSSFEIKVGIGFSILYFFDANNKGVELRLKEVKEEISEFCGQGLPDESVFSGNGAIATIKGVRFGVYVFAAQGNYGKLEDVLLPIMEHDNEDIFGKAQNYLQLKDEQRLKRLVVKKDGHGNIVEQRSGKKMKFDDHKSKICIAGQLQNSGKANTVIIRDSDYLTLDKINQSEKCREIIRFFNKT